MAVPLQAEPPGPDITDAEIFVEQFWHHGPAVHAYLNRRAGRQGADDLFGEVWLRAFKARASYQPRLGDPRPWLYGIARNTLRAHWRQAGRSEHALREIAADPWDEADGRVDAGRRLTELRGAMSRLTEDEREVLLLVAWERLSPAEVAVALGIPQGTARSRLHRARQLIRAEMPSPFAPTPLSTPKETAR